MPRSISICGGVWCRVLGGSCGAPQWRTDSGLSSNAADSLRARFRRQRVQVEPVSQRRALHGRHLRLHVRPVPAALYRTRLRERCVTPRITLQGCHPGPHSASPRATQGITQGHTARHPGPQGITQGHTAHHPGPHSASPRATQGVTQGHTSRHPGPHSASPRATQGVTQGHTARHPAVSQVAPSQEGTFENNIAEKYFSPRTETAGGNQHKVKFVPTNRTFVFL